MIVITLSKVPPSLRGVLTKWCQEVQTGVYVGRFSARIRDSLWERIQRDIGSGEAIHRLLTQKTNSATSSELPRRIGRSSITMGYRSC
jgi:CRISPR-associated endoribonuclease Cas2 subtype I-E